MEFLTPDYEYFFLNVYDLIYTRQTILIDICKKQRVNMNFFIVTESYYEYYNVTIMLENFIKPQKNAYYIAMCSGFRNAKMMLV